MDFFDIDDPAAVARLIGIVIPILVALLTKKVASSGLKATLNALLAAVGGSTVYLVAANGDGYDLKGFINAVMNTFIASIVTYYGLYKPTGVSETVNTKTADFGLGKPDLQTEDAVVPVEVPPAVAQEVQESVVVDPAPDAQEPVEVDDPLMLPPRKAVKKAPAKKAAPKRGRHDLLP